MYIVVRKLVRVDLTHRNNECVNSTFTLFFFVSLNTKKANVSKQFSSSARHSFIAYYYLLGSSTLYTAHMS